MRDLLSVLALIVIASACSASTQASPTTTVPESRNVTIAFRSHASTSQEAAVRRGLVSDSSVASATFRSANEVYSITGHDFPESNVVTNKTPTTPPGPISVRLVSAADVATFTSQYERMPGVASVTPMP